MTEKRINADNLCLLIVFTQNIPLSPISKLVAVYSVIDIITGMILFSPLLEGIWLQDSIISLYTLFGDAHDWTNAANYMSILQPLQFSNT